MWPTRIGELVRRMSSAGAKAMAVVDGGAEIYLHTGGQPMRQYATRRRGRWRLTCTPRGSTVRPLAYNRAETSFRTC